MTDTSHRLAKFLPALVLGLSSGVWAQTTSLDNTLMGLMMGGSYGQTLRISVAATPGSRCLATAGFRNSEAQPLEPDKIVDLAPGQVGTVEVNLGRLLRPGSREELLPAVRVLDGNCSATQEVFDNFAGRPTGQQDLMRCCWPGSDIGPVAIGIGQKLRFGVAQPPAADKTCSAVMAFFDANGRPVGPTMDINLLPGHFAHLDLDPGLLVSTSGPRIAQPRLLLPAVRTGDLSGCGVTLQVFDQLTGWTMEVAHVR